MFRRRKPRRNTRKDKKRKRGFRFFHRFLLGFKVLMACSVLVATSGFFIFIHDVLTQSGYFTAEEVIIEGGQRLSQDQIAEQARLKAGMNILAANLTAARKRLLSHPWIEEAEVTREIPCGLIIRIKEHVPLAIVDLGQKFLINEKGEIFKQWTPSDPANLPVVSGLDLSDLDAQVKPEPMRLDSPLGVERRSEEAQNHCSPMDAVMHVLRLGKESGSVLPNRLIKQIQVDREIGLTLHVTTQVKTINLGYHKYSDKYTMLKHIIVNLRKKRNFPVFDRIDLNNLNRIIVCPKKTNASQGNDKEV
jgi:cell division protein FtsQ